MQPTAFVLGAAALGATVLGGCAEPQTVVYAANEARIPPEVPAGETNWMNGRFTFEDARGEVVLVEAWHPSCTICLAAVPAVHDLDARYRERGLRVFTVTEVASDARDEDRAFAEEVADQHDIRYPTLLDDDGRWMESAGIEDTPTFLVVDRDGRVVLLHRGAMEKNSGAFRTAGSVIEEALGPPARSPPR